MRYIGISYTRSFDLSSNNLKSILDDDGNVTINNTFVLNLENIRNELSFIPLQSKSNTFVFSHPLGSIVQNKEKFDLYIGNKKIVSLAPSYHETDQCDSNIIVEVDKREEKVTFTTKFFVTTDLKVTIPTKDTRVNINGYSSKREWLRQILGLVLMTWTQGIQSIRIIRSIVLNFIKATVFVGCFSHILNRTLDE